MDSNQKLLEKLESFVPKYTDNDDYLEELFTFLEKIIHGDDISQYRANAYWSIYAEEAIKKIAKTVQENGLADFEERKNRLLEELQSRKKSLTRDIDSLEASKKWYTSQNEELKQTADSKRDKLSELDEKIKEKEQRLQEQVKKLKAMVKMMKMPVYVPNIERNFNHSINTSTMSDNIRQTLREIELKRQILEYAARNRILQNEVEVLMNILKSVVPNNADLTNILNNYNALGLLDSDNDSSLRK